MDGGPSTQLAVRGRDDLSVAGGWPVPDVLAFKRDALKTRFPFVGAPRNEVDSFHEQVNFPKE